MELFAYGQKVARENGLILVDTKYEFGKDADGVIRLIDEIHTPDSSRFWIAPTFDERFKKGESPENVDKVINVLNSRQAFGRIRAKHVHAMLCTSCSGVPTTLVPRQLRPVQRRDFARGS